MTFSATTRVIQSFPYGLNGIINISALEISHVARNARASAVSESGPPAGVDKKLPMPLSPILTL